MKSGVREVLGQVLIRTVPDSIGRNGSSCVSWVIAIQCPSAAYAASPMPCRWLIHRRKNLYEETRASRWNIATGAREGASMSAIILHHYWLSPYAEKIRRIFGFKKISWKSVLIPMIMPKPDLIALTGGYRKTPVMQLGADIYCDTDCIVRTIERLRPTPPLFPDGTEAMGYLVGPWQQELFLLAVQVIGASSSVIPDGFIEDRAKMFEGGLDVARMLAELPARRDQLRAKLDLVERQLGDGRAFVLGPQASLADFAIFHPLFALQGVAETAAVLEPFGRLNAWMKRVDAFGHGEYTDMEPSAALDIARGAEPVTASQYDTSDPNSRKPGDRVTVVHDSFGRDPVVGDLVASSAHEIAIRRRDDRVGDVVVHFPREHYLVSPA